MKLRNKIFLGLFLTFLVVIIIQAIGTNYFLKPKLLKIESNYVKEQFNRAEKNINEELSNIQKLVLDWSIWDDTYQFIQNQNIEYIKSNINDTTFTNTGVEFITILNKNKKEIYSAKYDYKTNKIIPFKNNFIKEIDDNKNKKFLGINNNKVVMVSYSKVFDTNEEKPFNGYLMMGFSLDSKHYKNISERAGVEVKFLISNKKLKNLILNPNNKYILAEKTVGSFGKNKINLRIKSKRWIGVIILKILKISILFSVVIYIIFFIIVGMNVYHSAIKEIESLKKQLENLPLDKFKEKIRIKGSGEFKVLADSINKMILEIQNMNMEILLGNEKYRALFEESTVIHIMVDENYCIREVNKAAEKIIGYNREEIVGESILSSFDEENNIKIKNIIDNIFLGTGSKETEVMLKAKNGDIKYLIIKPSNFLLIEEGDKYRVLLVGTDITEKKLIENEIKRYATFDELTGLYNRRIGIEMLEKNLQMAKRNNNNLIVIFIDVNGLKKINDSLGHKNGDKLIKITADILKESSRESDIVCRLGGDEFLVILVNCDLVDSEKFWNRVLENKERKNRSGKFDFKVSLSYGIASLDENREMSAYKIIEIADNRMYEDKKLKKAERN
ncbi:diguanylate cyclase [Haliovirga abyssi]|uniref:Diguanylate cyclase n=1 Tax=Haliovirga abyssi TaxID=2996794 RepID=A0AAU9DWD3_9FUSO|nr:diguanylate cyclase [Haliovirga abyssi]BDU51714.1 hypothetical protein HLVA_22830 [Haliovirga abyssi]